MTRTTRPALAAIAAAVTFAACGESAEDKAQAAVCSARADIKQQVDELKGMSATTATANGVEANLRAIRGGLEKIAGAQDDLKGDRRQEVQEASQAFRSDVTALSRELLTSVSLSDGKQQVQAALQGLAASYEAALAPIDCP